MDADFRPQISSPARTIFGLAAALFLLAWELQLFEASRGPAAGAAAPLSDTTRLAAGGTATARLSRSAASSAASSANGHATGRRAAGPADLPGALPRPRVLTSDGCSGSTFLWEFSSRLFALHTGYAAVSPSSLLTPAEWETFARDQPDSVKEIVVRDRSYAEYLDGAHFPMHFVVNRSLPRTTWRRDTGYNMVKRTWDQIVVDHVFAGTGTLHAPRARGRPLEVRNVILAPKEGGAAACAPHSSASNCTANAMVVKMLLYQMWQPGVGPALAELGPLLVHTYRRNWLGRLVCKIRDATTHAVFGQPVYGNGTRAFLYFQRRSDPTPTTFVKLDVAAVKLGLITAMRQGCTEGLTGYPWHDSDKSTMASLAQTVGQTLDDFPHLSEENLVAFEYEQEGTPQFVQSLADWKMYMRAWGVIPDEAIILQAMRAQGIASRVRSPPRRSIYNWDEVEAVLRELASSPDPSHCNWTWLGDT